MMVIRQSLFVCAGWHAPAGQPGPWVPGPLRKEPAESDRPDGWVPVSPGNPADDEEDERQGHSGKSRRETQGFDRSCPSKVAGGMLRSRAISSLFPGLNSREKRYWPTDMGGRIGS